MRPILLMSIIILYGVWYMGQADTIARIIARKLSRVFANSGWQLLRSLAIIESNNVFLLGKFMLAVTPTLADPQVYDACRQLGLFLGCKYSNLTRVFIKLSMKMTAECRKQDDVITLSDCVKLVISKLMDINNKMISRMSAALVMLSTNDKAKSVVNMFKGVRDTICEISGKGKYLFGSKTSDCFSKRKLMRQLKTIDQGLLMVDYRFEKFMAKHCFVQKNTGNVEELNVSDEKDLIDLNTATTDSLLNIFSKLVDTLIDAVVDRFHDNLGLRYNALTNTSHISYPEENM